MTNSSTGGVTGDATGGMTSGVSWASVWVPGSVFILRIVSTKKYTVDPNLGLGKPGGHFRQTYPTLGLLLLRALNS